MNDNLEKQLQFTDGVCAEKDPWGEPYLYTTTVDVSKQTRYILFAIRGGRDTVSLSLEDVIYADSNEMKVYTALKQV